MGTGETGPSAGPGVLRWGLLTYAWLVIASILLVGGAVPWVLSQSKEPVYEAQALVVARHFEMSLDALPRYGEAVFYGGAVAQQVAAGLNLAGDPQELFSGPLSVITGQDSVVMTVVGQSDDPAVAASLANEAANAFLTELNRPGPEFGVFVLQSAAAPPQQPIGSGPGAAVGILVGVLAGAALGLALVGFLLAVRKPVVGLADFEEVTGTPVLGVVTLPTKRRDIYDPRLVPGMGALVRRLAALPPGTMQVVSLPELARERSALVALLSSALDRRRATPYLFDGAAGQQSGRNGDAGSRLLVVDDRPTLEQEVSRVDATVLLAAEGTPKGDLSHLVAEHLDAALVGVVVVRSRRWLTSRRVRVHSHRSYEEDSGGGEPVHVEHGTSAQPSRI